MDDKLYNQIFLKPRFQLEFEMNSQVLLEEIKKHLNKLVPMDSDKRIDQRIRKFSAMGVVNSWVSAEIH